MSNSATTSPGGSREVFRTLILSVLLILAWLLWSGLFKPLLIGLGAFSIIIVLALARRMMHFDSKLFALKYGVRILGYWAWLVKEIFLSSLQVTRVVLTPKPDIRPVIVTVDADQMTQVDQVVFGNSITLTPGTLTLDVHQDKITVHALTEAGADALKKGDMQRRVRALLED